MTMVDAVSGPLAVFGLQWRWLVDLHLMWEAWVLGQILVVDRGMWGLDMCHFCSVHWCQPTCVYGAWSFTRSFGRVLTSIVSCLVVVWLKMPVSVDYMGQTSLDLNLPYSSSRFCTLSVFNAYIKRDSLGSEQESASTYQYNYGHLFFVGTALFKKMLTHHNYVQIFNTMGASVILTWCVLLRGPSRWYALVQLDFPVKHLIWRPDWRSILEAVVPAFCPPFPTYTSELSTTAWPIC